jgi:hypothetical protein
MWIKKTLPFLVRFNLLGWLKGLRGWSVCFMFCWNLTVEIITETFGIFIQNLQET